MTQSPSSSPRPEWRGRPDTAWLTSTDPRASQTPSNYHQHDTTKIWATFVCTWIVYKYVGWAESKQTKLEASVSPNLNKPNCQLCFLHFTNLLTPQLFLCVLMIVSQILAVMTIFSYIVPITSLMYRPPGMAANEWVTSPVFSNNSISGGRDSPPVSTSRWESHDETWERGLHNMAQLGLGALYCVQCFIFHTLNSFEETIKKLFYTKWCVRLSLRRILFDHL